MERYRLAFRISVAKHLLDIPKKDVSLILKCIEVLAEDPRAKGCEKLSGQERYRVRRGSYRIVYEIQDDALVVVVVEVSHRRDVCRLS